jgi:hypothetical protein
VTQEVDPINAPAMQCREAPDEHERMRHGVSVPVLGGRWKW